MRGNILIRNGENLIHGLALDPFRGDRGGGDGGSASECFEFGFDNVSVVVYFDLEFHYVSACWCSDESLLIVGRGTVEVCIV